MNNRDTENQPIVYVNGSFTSEADAKISVFDHVVLYGDGVYDTLVGWNQKLFRLDEHLDRLYESAHAVKIEIPHSKDELKEIVKETVRRNGFQNTYVKLIVTRGVGAEPLLSPDNCTPGMIVFSVPYMSQAGSRGSARGIRMITSSMRRVPNESMSTKVKACNYMNHVLMRMEANERGADDAIELDLEGYVCEAPGYNVFVVKNGRLATPADNILVGVTRQTVIEIAENQGISVTEGRLQPFDVYNADEAFLSSTAGGIVPVIELDGRVIGSGSPGQLTERIQELYLELLERGDQSETILPLRSEDAGGAVRHKSVTSTSP